MSGWSPERTAWIASMAGKGVILIGETTPLAMIVSEKMPVDMFSQGATSENSP
jgi:hypothetical protein